MHRYTTKWADRAEKEAGWKLRKQIDWKYNKSYISVSQTVTKYTFIDSKQNLSHSICAYWGGSYGVGHITIAWMKMAKSPDFKSEH